MDSRVYDILGEWENDCFYTDEYLSEAYTTLLGCLLEATDEERADQRLPQFLEAGYHAYTREQDGADPHAHITYGLALSMIGRGAGDTDVQSVPPTTRPSPQASPSKAPDAPLSPQAGPSRSPASSKRRREEEDEEGEDEEGEGTDSSIPTLEVLQSRERTLKRFSNVKFREEIIAIKGLGDSLPDEATMSSLFDTVIQRQKDALGAKDTDKVILELQSSDNEENPIWLSMRNSNQLDGRVVLDRLSRVLNSNESFMVNGQLRVSYIHIETPHPGGRRTDRVANESTDQWFQRKIDTKSIWSPHNPNDSMCLTRSVAIAIAHGGMKRQAIHKMKKPDSTLQEREAKRLCDLAQIAYDRPAGIDEVNKLQNALPDYRLCVFKNEKAECEFKGTHTATRKNIYLLLHKGHFSAILFPCQAFQYRFECKRCVTFYNNEGAHRCPGSCWRCLGHTKHEGVVLTRCPDCRHQFAGAECFQNHKTLKLPNTDETKCSTFKFCGACQRSYSLRRGQKHECSKVYCKYCKTNVEENHLCFMQKWTEKEKKRGFKYITIYFDIETEQDEPVPGKPETFEHKPVLLVSQAVCDLCVHVEQNDYFCPVCKTRQHVFHNMDDRSISVIGQFIDYLQSFGGKTELLLVAHNGRSFDFVFFINEIVSRSLKIDPILQGAKIISMTVGGSWKFIDSLSFLPMPLSAMPKSFGLQELKKGWFPFLAINKDYFNYKGVMLPKKFYCVTSMKNKAAEEFESWYNDQVSSGVEFNFRQDLLSYCISDVTILRQSARAFRELFEQLAGFDPMFNCITLSSACMCAYRRNFLKPNTIGLVPPGGYHGRGRQSHQALQWLDYESYKLGEVIQTIYSHREISVLGRRVDGYIELTLPDGSKQKRIYQYHGDYWHNCPQHFPAIKGVGEDRYTQTVRLTQLFRSAGFHVIEKWECSFKHDLEHNPDVIAYFQAHPTTRVTPLRLRDALAGGRTSAMQWYCKADATKNEKIKMVDVVSEYPSCNLRGKYPVGHPTLFLQGNPNMPPVDQWNGVIKCTVLPPRDLFVPLLPYRASGRLMFPLCRTCVETLNEGKCTHDDPKDRQLTDTWCSPELVLAIQEKRYQLLEVHEVYQYPSTVQFDPETGTDGLFSGYIRCFMALKVQASGWPANCTTPEQKQAYMDDLKKYDGITIDPTKVEKNSSIRQLSKLLLNSFWGKFGEKTIRPKTEFIYNNAELMTMVSDSVKEVSGLVPLGEESLQVTWIPAEDTDESLPTSSLLHAAFTTCFGRLQLYKYLDMVQQRAIYCDTDSVAYISRPGEEDLPLGSHLGDLTDQIAEDYGENSHIMSFLAGGPKNYSYTVAVNGDPTNTKVCIKVRGISINSSCSDIVTFEKLKEMVKGQREKVSVPIPHQIARVQPWRIVTRLSSKTWQAKNRKRRRVDLAHTVPHGYTAWKGDQEDEEMINILDGLATM